MRDGLFRGVSSGEHQGVSFAERSSPTQGFRAEWEVVGFVGVL